MRAYEKAESKRDSYLLQSLRPDALTLKSPSSCIAPACATTTDRTHWHWTSVLLIHKIQPAHLAAKNTFITLQRTAFPHVVQLPVVHSKSLALLSVQYSSSQDNSLELVCILTRIVPWSLELSTFTRRPQYNYPALPHGTHTETHVLLSCASAARGSAWSFF